jgi:hypothetical protein
MDESVLYNADFENIKLILHVMRQSIVMNDYIWIIQR